MLVEDDDDVNNGAEDSIDLEKAKHKGGVDTRVSDASSSSKAVIESPQAVRDNTVHFKDSVLAADIQNAISEDPDPDSLSHFRNLNGFFSFHEGG